MRFRPFAFILGFLSTAGAALAEPAQDQAPQKRLMTGWASQVNADRVLPEYPRPQMVRPEWKNLNGFWDYAITDLKAQKPDSFSGRILVPFPVESALSGVTNAVSPDQALWYRRKMESPKRPAGSRVLLHFGAVDWDALVYVNGSAAGTHRGGYDPFTFDITDLLVPGQVQELSVRVLDPTNKGPQPRGKQVLNPRGIWYTAVTGIWQTVWLETVPATHIESLRIEPDIDRGLLRIQAKASGPEAGKVKARVRVLDGDRAVGEISGEAGDALQVKVPNARLWSPAAPFLYGVEVSLSSGDSVKSYAGMRKISVGPDAEGIHRLLLNNQPLFQYGPLDQGWWPDGLYTAPTDEALLFDIETQKKLGFNTIRKHVKVEPERWYYHCDRLGMLVWQDMPSGDNNTPEGKENFQRELGRMVASLRNHPSIVMWVPFNEGWGQHDTEKYVSWLKQEDTGRLVNNASGWDDKKSGDVADVHVYPGPSMPPTEASRAAVLGEFGGLGLPLEGHTWLERGNWGYRSYASAGELETAYRNLIQQLRILIGQGVSAAIYTQTTDVEIEVNGLMTYDRAIVKMPAGQMAGLNATLFAPPPKLRTVVPGADAEPADWRFVTDAPGEGWMQPDFNDSAWNKGRSGFGTLQGGWSRVNTVWKSPDIWLRRNFELRDTHLSDPHLRILHDDAAEVYLNGRLIATLPGNVPGYVYIPLDEAAKRNLRQGVNSLAVHVHQERGGQYIDLGLVEVVGNR